MVFDSSQAYTSAAPAFLAHILHREDRKSEQEFNVALTYKQNSSQNFKKQKVSKFS